MRSIPDAIAVNDQDALTPHALNAEIAELVAVVHGIDRDNIALAGIFPVRVALDAWGGIKTGIRTTERTITLAARDANQQVFDIPDNSGDPWFQAITTGDGVLEIELSLEVRVEPGASNIVPDMWIGVVVDGLLAGKSPWMNAGLADGGTEVWYTGDVNVCVPVPAGAHRVAFKFCVHGYASPTVNWDADLIFCDGTYWVHEERR